ncbi:MAG: hypothetical protein AB7V56_13760 [Candidatus Nitrosocosmicus sp.]
MIKITLRYIKDRIECFDDYFPYRIKNCKLKDIHNWLDPFTNYHDGFGSVHLSAFSSPL